MSYSDSPAQTTALPVNSGYSGKIQLFSMDVYFLGMNSVRGMVFA